MWYSICVVITPCEDLQKTAKENIGGNLSNVKNVRAYRSPILLKLNSVIEFFCKFAKFVLEKSFLKRIWE